jgi:hypothetical protein
VKKIAGDFEPDVSSMRICHRSAFVCVAVAVSVVIAGAQVMPRSLITQPIDETQVITLKGNTHPLARPQFDIGAAPPDLPLNRMLLVLRRSPQQDLALRKLLDDQQDKASPVYHKWLTADEFGQQFGPTDQDLQTVTGWLQSHGFQVNRVTHGRTVIEFSGVEEQIEQALHTQIHRYVVNGEEHWANASNPQIPDALAPVVVGIDSLHNFSKRPLHELLGVFQRSKTGQGSPVFTSIPPRGTLFTGGGACGLAAGPCYAISPYDLATIYNILPLWNANPPIDGTGQTIAIVSQSDIYPQDFSDFRKDFALPAGTLNIIYDGPPPVKLASQGDELESDLDVQWAGAVAKGATIDLVESIWTNSTSGVDLSALYIVDNNLAPILSESYGACELDMGTAGNQFYYQLWQQAAAQGISVFVSTGDSGSDACDQGASIASQGLSVNGIASTPYNVAVGGTDFADLHTQSTYWNSTNDPVTFASAKGYVPESTWNDTCTNAELFSFTGDSTAEQQCNDSKSGYLPGTLAPVGGSGGASNCTTSTNQSLSSCRGGYPKPPWQSGPGVPNGGMRNLPDVSLFAGNGMNSSFYLACEFDIYGGCTGDPYNMVALGGTSASAPAFAGIMALINQKMGSRQGNPNYILYPLAAQTSVSCDSTGNVGSSCIFYDITAGTVAMPCLTGTPNCVTNTAGDANGVLAGYSTNVGYDLATGLGSVNVTNLVNNWHTVSFRPTVATLSLSPTTLTHGSAVNVDVTVSPTSGTGTPSGFVSLLTSAGLSAGLFNLSNGAVASNTAILPGGTYTVTAHYAGDGTYAASDSSPGIRVAVTPEPSITTLQAFTLGQNGNSIPFTSGPYGGAIVYLSAVVAGKSGQGVPTGTVNLTQTLNGTTTNFTGDPFPLDSKALTMLPFPGYNWWAYSPGKYTMGATYSGDAGFQKSTATNVSFTITPAQTNTALSILGCSPVNGVCSSVPGQSLTISAYVNYSGAAFTGGVFISQPSGTVTFYSNGTALGPPMGVDPSIYPPGASINITPAAGLDNITAQYSGDSNFAGSTSSAVLLEVGAPFLMATNPSAVSVSSAGQSGSATLTITAQNGFFGTISNFACSGLPAETMCNFQPASVTGSGSVTLTIVTTPLGQLRRGSAAASEKRQLRGIATAVLPFLAVCLIALPAQKRRRDALALVMLIFITVTLPSCGGGSGAAGGSNPVPSITSLSPAQQAAGSQSQTLTINGSGFASSSTVSYNGVSRAAKYVSASQLSILLNANDLTAMGSYPVVVTNPAPGGGNSNPVNFSVVQGTPTGTFNVTVTATSGPLINTTTFSLMVQ